MSGIKEALRANATNVIKESNQAGELLQKGDGDQLWGWADESCRWTGELTPSEVSRPEERGKARSRV